MQMPEEQVETLLAIDEQRSEYVAELVKQMAKS
jgi:hypothetical protein